MKNIDEQIKELICQKKEIDARIRELRNENIVGAFFWQERKDGSKFLKVFSEMHMVGSEWVVRVKPICLDLPEHNKISPVRRIIQGKCRDDVIKSIGCVIESLEDLQRKIEEHDKQKEATA